MAAATLAGVSARGMVNLDRAEDTLQRVIDQVNLQAMQIASLMGLVEGLVDRETLSRVLRGVDERVGALGQQVTALEEATHVPGADPRLSIGQVVGTQGATLTSLCDGMTRKAEAHDVSAQLQEADRRMEAHVTQLYEWAAPREVVDRLQEGSLALHAQVSVLEQNLAYKADKAELSHLETANSRIKAFNSFIDDTTTRLTRLEGDVSGLNQEVAGEASAARALEQRVTATEDILQDSDRLRAEMASSLERLRSYESRLNGKADVSTAQHALQLADDAAQRLDSLQADYASWKAENLHILREINRELEHTAPLEEVERKLDSRVWDRHWRVAMERLDKKADTLRLDDIDTRVRSAEQVLSQVERQSGLALRFVNWFSERGQAYEHNLQTLDRTMGRLAQSSLPSRRRPFDNRVRFTTDPPPPDMGTQEARAGAGAGAGAGGGGGGQEGTPPQTRARGAERGAAERRGEERGGAQTPPPASN